MRYVNGVRADIKRLWMAVFLSGVKNCLWRKTYKIVESSREAPILWSLVEEWTRDRNEYAWSKGRWFESICDIIRINSSAARKKIEQKPEGWHEGETILESSYDLDDLKIKKRKLQKIELHRKNFTSS